MSAYKCFHCHEDIPKGVNILAKIDGNTQVMCCHGCKAVAEFINEQGYCEFYNYRGESQPTTKAQVAEKKWQSFDDEINFALSTQLLSKNIYTVTIHLEGIYCSACGWLIDKHLRSLNGINDVKLNTITKLLKVEFDLNDIKLSQILTTINYLGYQPGLGQNENAQQMEIRERKNALKRLVVAGFGMMFIMTLSVPLYSAEYQGMDAVIKRFFLLLSLLVATGIYFYSGKTFLQNAYRDLTNKHLGMDVPVALSISLAYFASTWNVLSKNGQITYFDSMVMFIFFLLAGRFIEMTVRHQGMTAKDAIAHMVPSSVTIVENMSDKLIPYDLIKKGDILKVSTGDIVAIDGVIVSGNMKVDESMITGESKPLSKSIGDTVMAGSAVYSGLVEIKSTAIGDETLLASLSQLLENAQLHKPKALILVDKIASWFIAVVLLLALSTAIYYTIYQPDKTMLTVLAVLVATCPCALSLATPAALTAASVQLMKSGVLVNNLDAITRINKIKNWFFDKTGTLTEPFMTLVKTHIFGELSEQHARKIIAALEHNSSHPIASAFNDFYDEGIEILNFIEKPSLGVEAKIGLDVYKAGTKQWCDETSDIYVDCKNTIIYLSKNNLLIAAFELENQLRKGSKTLVDDLLKQNYKVTIISGDKNTAVATIAESLSITDYYSKQTPEQKINLIHVQQDQSKPTLMIGDGVNDAPVLAQSDVSISFNQGTLLARAASDLIIMGNSFSSIHTILKISQKTNAIIKQNIIWALGYNLSVIPLAVMGILTPWMAAIGMSVSSLFVILNAKRILINS